MALTISVPFKVRADSGIRESVSPGYPNPNPHATVIFSVAQEHRSQLVADLIGTSVRVSHPGAAAPAILRTFPFRYPAAPNLICRSIESIEFFGGPAWLAGLGYPWLARKRCYVTATFGPMTFDDVGQYDTSGQPYTTTTCSAGLDKMTVPGNIFRFADNVTTNTNAAINLPVMQINVKRLMLPWPPLAEIINLIGGVNGDPIVWPQITFPVGTVLMVGGNVDLSFDTMGNVQWTADYQFSVRNVPWSHYMHPNRTIGFAPVFDGNGDLPYPFVDFSLLP